MVKALTPISRPASLTEVCGRYIHTAIIGGGLDKLIDNSGAGWATVEDAATAMMHIVSDQKIDGRALAIVPRSWKDGSNGYIDLEQDDFKEGSWMHEAQENVFKPFKLAAQQQ